MWMMRWKVRERRHHRHVLCLMEDDVNDHCKHFRDETCGVWMKYHCFRHWMMLEMGRDLDCRCNHCSLLNL